MANKMWGVNSFTGMVPTHVLFSLGCWLGYTESRPEESFVHYHALASLGIFFAPLKTRA